MALVRLKVWDRGTRYFLWLNLLCVLVLGILGYWTELRAYIRKSRSIESSGNDVAVAHRFGYLGHNPLGRLMVVTLLTLLLVQGVTGLVLAGTDLYKPPFGAVIAQWVTGGDQDKLVSLHIVGVVVAEVREKNGLVSAMITGDKVFDRLPDDTD